MKKQTNKTTRVKKVTFIPANDFDPGLIPYYFATNKQGEKREFKVFRLNI